ncbi:MAG: carboxypeptidase-like regulatory domain-containing protein, partial [Bacteroidota bacterium]
MKKSTKLQLVVFWVMMATNLALFPPTSLVAQYIELDVNRLESQGKAVVTATTSDLGYVSNCFDGDIYSIMRSANINPAFVQVAFNEAQSIKQIRVLLGEPDYPAINSNSWWVETADNQADMDNRSGSYQLIVPRRDDVNGIWDDVVLPQAVEAKIWKFWIERTVGDDYVHIPELELWADDFFPDSSVAGFQLIDAQTDAVITNLLDGTRLYSEDLSQSLAIEVLVNEPVGSLRISVNGPGLSTAKNESAPPYASFGDDGGDFNGKMMTAGTYTATATPYSGRNAMGEAGTPVQISFEIIAPGQPILEPEYETIDPFLATPVDNAANIIPVLVIRFLPTEDGENLDVSKVPDFHSLGEITLEDMKDRIDLLDKRIKFMLEEGSKYHGYKNPDAQPMVGYKVVEYITVYEQSPAGKVRFTDKNGYPVYGVDYFEIFERFDVEHYVNDLGIKHIWLWDAPLDSSWPSYDPGIHDPASFRGPPEANMASPTTGDVSNSYQDNSDMPVYDHTYVVFGNNFRRDQKEAVGHNYGHQIERMFRYIDSKDNNQEELFWQKFVGTDENLNFVTGRCGWSHMPPNTTEEYDYDNPTLVESDIEDWRPDNSGEKKLVNVDTWNDQSYNWPAGTGNITNWRERTETYWHIYKMQAFPGSEATIPYQDDYVISDWWNIFANWDEVNNAGKLLYEEVQPPGITFRLIDADTDQSIAGLTNGQSVPVPGLPRNLAIEVLTTEPVGSFKIQVVGPGINNTKNESVAPYASFGDDNGDFLGRILEAGSYTVTATPYSGRNATGEAGTPAQLSFTLSEDDNQSPVASFT